MIDIVQASSAHIGTIAARARAIDALESRATGRTPKQALRAGLAASSCAWTAKVNGRAEAMFGVSAVSTLDGIGCPWMLMTDDGARQARALVVIGRQYVAEMHAMFRVLTNHVHRDNDVAIRWLQHLGFTVGATCVIGGEPMREFVRVR